MALSSIYSLQKVPVSLSCFEAKRQAGELVDEDKKPGIVIFTGSLITNASGAVDAHQRLLLASPDNVATDLFVAQGITRIETPGVESLKAHEPMGHLVG